MGNPFGTKEMAEGYATKRPAVHGRFLQAVWPYVPKPALRAVDVGCGAGLSTRPLRGFVRHCIGLEPAQAMLPWARQVAPNCDFVAGAAEALPFPAACVDLITAAGSLNYVDLDRFFAETKRVLTQEGVLAIYDFSTARQFRGHAGLPEWFAHFEQRYPWPPSEGRVLDREVLTRWGSGLRVVHQELHVGEILTRKAYVEYLLTETNVAYAVRRGTTLEEVRAWCHETLKPIWRTRERELVFTGYVVCMKRH
jgi:SAM-dependent methyltransferase